MVDERAALIETARAQIREIGRNPDHFGPVLRRLHVLPIPRLRRVVEAKFIPSEITKYQWPRRMRVL